MTCMPGLRVKMFRSLLVTRAENVWGNITRRLIAYSILLDDTLYNLLCGIIISTWMTKICSENSEKRSFSQR